MRHSKHQKNETVFYTESLKRKSICPRCSKNVNGKKGSKVRLLFSHKNICKSSKCLTHARNLQSGSESSEIKFKKPSRSVKNSENRKPIKINLIKAPCAVDEFEDTGNNFEDIDNEIFTKIENIVEDSDFGKEINIENIVCHGLLKEIINRTIIWPLKKPEIFKGLRTAPKGVLFFGPPGTGKTSLGKLIAHETDSTFFNISPSTLTSKWMGESEKLVRAMFLVAKARQPSVIFIDEVDSLLSQRIADENGSVRRMKNEFFICMDGGEVLAGGDRVLVIGATNRPQELDEAAIRRFFKRFYISLPDKSVRKTILQNLLEHECHSLDETDINDLVRRTEGYSLADLKNLSQEAAMGPIKPLSKTVLDNLKPRDIRPISIEDFFYALQLIKPTVSKEQVNCYEIWDSMYGYGGEYSKGI